MAKKKVDKIAFLRAKRIKLLVSQDNKLKLNEIQKKLDYFDFGIK